MKHIVVTYNVLSPSLTDWFDARPKYLDAKKRFNKIVNAKLHRIVKAKSIICLQEVSRNWAAKFYKYFLDKNYCFIYSSYGHNNNGYMGIAIAFPKNKYELLECNIKRIVDTVRWPKKLNKQSWVNKYFKNIIDGTYRYLTGKKEERCYINESKRKYNTTIIVRLRGEDKKQFCVSTYHMPCAYKYPKIMIIHSTLLVNYINEWSKNDPYIIAGDFNLKPYDPGFLNLIGQKIDKKYQINESYIPKLKTNLKSAYKKLPEFTNFSKNKDSEISFMETLDYVFYNGDIEFIDLIKTPLKKNIESKTFPDRNEPSDHIMIGGTFIIGK